jgi:hypothetical protein
VNGRTMPIPKRLTRSMRFAVGRWHTYLRRHVLRA